MERQPYHSDVTDEIWAAIESIVPAPKSGGHPPAWDRREIVNGIFYWAWSGARWRALPHDLPPWQTVYHYYRTWRRDGTLEAIRGRLSNYRWRKPYYRLPLRLDHSSRLR
jgi:putative transposase